MSKIIPVLGVIILAFAVAPLAHADPIYGTSALGELTGSRSEPGSIVTGDEWADDETIQSLSWLVMDLGGGAWSYEYTFTNFRAPDISHFILDLTDDCVGRDDEAADPGCVTDISGPLAFNTYDSSGPGTSNPGFPVGASITGVKFDFGEDVYSFLSNRSPVYGDFYVNGGNESFADNIGLENHLSENVFDFIVRPDGVVPEPGTLLLLGLGLIGLGAMARRRKA